MTPCSFCRQVLRAELELTKDKMEEVRALAQELMSTRGENCQAQVGPKVEQLNQRFDIISERIASGLVVNICNSTVIYKCLFGGLNVKSEFGSGHFPKGRSAVRSSVHPHVKVSSGKTLTLHTICRLHIFDRTYRRWYMNDHLYLP